MVRAGEGCINIQRLSKWNIRTQVQQSGLGANRQPPAQSFAIVVDDNKIVPARQACPAFLQGPAFDRAALFTILEIRFIMKKLFSVAALLLLISPLSQAQVHFDSGSAKPKNLRDMRYNERQLHESEQARKRRVLVRCRDGSKHIARVCRRHGGIA